MKSDKTKKKKNEQEIGQKQVDRKSNKKIGHEI